MVYNFKIILSKFIDVKNHTVPITHSSCQDVNGCGHSLSITGLLGVILDTQTLKNLPSGHPIFCEEFLEMSISSI